MNPTLAGGRQVRLNDADTYGPAAFAAAGIAHVHLEFPDCTVPAPLQPSLPQPVPARQHKIPPITRRYPTCYAVSTLRRAYQFPDCTVLPTRNHGPNHADCTAPLPPPTLPSPAPSGRYAA